MQGHRVASVLAVLGASLVLAACGGGSSEGEIMDKAETAAKGGGGGGGGTKSATLVADAGVASLMLAWNDTGAQQYNVYLSSSPGCDIKQYTLCPDGKMLANVRSPLKAGALVNGRVYYAQVESVTNRSASLSNEAAARPTTLEFNDTVWSIAAAADGTKYLGGDFTRVGLTSGQGVALDVLSGRPSIAGFPIIGDGGVTSAAPDGAGGWFIGGDYRRVGQANKPYLMRVRADGSVDTAWNPVPNSAVNAIAVMNGVVYIAGNFTAINGQQRLTLAALDAATGQLLPWNPVPNNGVWTIAAVNGTIYVGGTFTMIGGFYRNQAAAIDAFGNILPWDPNTNGTVATLTASGSTIYMGGFFTTVSGQARNKLAALDAVTGKPTAWNASLVCGGCEVRALAVSGTTLYVGGRFPQIGTVARNGLAAVDTRNAAILPWNPNPDAPVWSLGVTNDSRGTTVYAGGEFTAIGGQKRSYLAAVDAQGAALAWAPEPIGKVEVVRIAGSHLLAGGRFTGLGAIVRNGLAAIDATGALKSWNPNAYGGARALAVTGNTIYAGGVFTTVGGQAHQHLVKIDSTGAVDPWAPSFNWPVRALAVGASGNLYVGGEFSAVNGTPRSRIAAFSSSGQLLGVGAQPRSLRVRDGGRAGCRVRRDAVCRWPVQQHQRRQPQAPRATHHHGHRRSDGLGSVGLRDRKPGRGGTCPCDHERDDLCRGSLHTPGPQPVADQRQRQHHAAVRERSCACARLVRLDALRRRGVHAGLQRHHLGGAQPRRGARHRVACGDLVQPEHRRSRGLLGRRRRRVRVPRRLVHAGRWRRGQRLRDRE